MRGIDNIFAICGAVIALLIVFAALRSLWHFLRGLFDDARSFADHPEVAAPLAVVTLVHGTFARGAPWTRAGSALSEAVTQHFGGRVQLRRFDWSGRNSFAARRNAASALAEDAAAVIAKHGRTPHYCIGHSHGGNVVIDAALACNRGEIDGVVCLATPVLTARHRHFSPLVRGFIGFGFWWALCVPFLNLETDTMTDMEMVAVALAALGATAWYFAGQRIAAKVCRLQPLSALDPKRVAFIRSPFDEASGIIGFANLTSWIITRLTDGPFALAEYLEELPPGTSRVLLALKMIGLIGAGLVVGMIVTGLAAFRRLVAVYPLAEDFGMAIALFLMLVGGLGLAGTIIFPLMRQVRARWLYRIVLFGPYLVTMMVGGLLFMPAIILVSIVHALTVGVELIVSSVFVEVTAEPCPAGNWTVYQLNPPPERSLRHSSVYNSPGGMAALRLALSGLQDSDAITLLPDEPIAIEAAAGGAASVPHPPSV